MNESAINVRYAKALFLTAKEKNRIANLKSDIELVLNVCNNSADFILLLESPVIKMSKKSELISSIFKEKVDHLTMNFLELIMTNKREVYIPGICRNFLSLTRKDQNIKLAVLTTTTEVTSDSIQKVTNLLEQELKAKIELSTKIKPEIIGGLVLRLDDKQFDASIATQLKKIKQTLLESEL